MVRLFAGSWLALVSVGFVASGCSLIGLDDFDVPQCGSNLECQPLNDRDGIAADACRLYQCAQGACTFRLRDDDDDGFASMACGGNDCNDNSNLAFPGGSESCDGVDNDCNGVVDDQVSDGPEVSALVTGASNPTFVSYGPRSDGLEPSVAFRSGASSFFNVPFRDEGTDPQALGFARANDVSPAGFSMPAIASGCPTPTVDSPPPPSAMVMGARPDSCQTHADCYEAEGNFCNGFETCEPDSPASDPVTGCRAAMFDPCTAGDICDEASQACIRVNGGACQIGDAATTELQSGEWLAAVINVSGCGDGQLRVGYLTEGEAAMDGSAPGRDVLLRGDERRSTIYLGVDPTATANPCTGGSRPMGSPVGAVGPAIAALAADPTMNRRRPQGLVAWIADTTARSAGPSPAPAATVEILGVWQELGSAGGVDVGWINGTGNGLPERLPSATVGSAAPALTAISGTGYFLAYGKDGGGIAARYIPAFPDPAEVSTMEPFRSDVMASSPTRTTPAIADLGMEVSLDGGGSATANVDFLTAAAAPPSGARVRVGLSWLEGTDVYFSTAMLNTSSGAISEFAPMQISTGSASEPQISYTAIGITIDGGGWVVTWIGDGEVRAVRIDSEGTIVDSAPIRTGITGAQAPFAAPASNRGPRLYFQRGTSIEVGAGICGVP
ncbi:MAG: putative metal-binding motif-containing protein [Myxococcota bacterium]